MSGSKPPKEITKRLKALRRRVRRLQLMRGLLGVLTVALGGVMVVMAADYFLAPLPVLARWGLFVALVVVVLAAVWFWLLKPLARRISLVQVARWLEARHPEIQERVSSALELSGTEGGVSESLLAELVDAAKVDVADLDPGIELKGRRAKKWLWPAAGLAAVFLILFAVWPSEFGRLLARAVAPYSDLGNAGAGRFEILPGDQELLAGDALEITIRFSDEKVEHLTMFTEREDGSVTEETLSVVGVTEGKSVFVYRLSAATESFRYRMRSGRAESDPYQVRVWPTPVLESVVAAYDFPVYTDLSPSKRPLGRGVTALTGTSVVLEGRPNTPVESGKFLLDGKEAGRVNVTPGASGGRVEISWTMEPEASGLGQVILTHRLGREVEGLRFPVTVVKDEPPVVTLLTPMPRELRVKPTEQIVMGYEVEEDVGLAEVSIELRVNGKAVESLAEVIPDRVQTSRKPLWRGEGMVYVGGLVDRWKNAREVKMRIAVRDTLPEDLEGPGMGYSEWLTVKIDRNAESLVRQELRAQQSDVRESLAKAEQDVREAKARLDAARVKDEKKDVQKYTEGQMKKAEEKLAEAKENLEELAERMENGVQAAKVKDVLEAMEKVKEAQEHAENTPLQDTGEARQAEVDMAKLAAEEAIEKLQEIREEVQQDEQRVQQLAKLAELAQKEEQIAREAEERVEQNGEESKADQQLRQEQSQVENALRQQIQQNPEAKAEALERQAEQARELSEEARDLSEQQAALSEAAKNQDSQKQAGETPEGAEAEEAVAEAIREQLEQAQEQIVQEAKEQAAESRQKGEARADLLPEAVSDAEEALGALQNGEPEAAAAAAQEAAEMLEELAKGGGPESGEEKMSEDGGQKSEGEASGEQSGEQPGEERGEGEGESPELAELAERQGQVAEALEALAGGNVEEALQALQEMQAEEAAGLAEAIEDLPQVDGRSGPMGEAVGNAQNGERQAEMAAQAGEQGKAQAAAQQHGEASKSIGKAADALEKAAADFEAKAHEAAQQEPGNQSLPVPPGALAEAFEKASQAADAESAGEAAQASQAAAEALGQAASQAMQNMQRGQQPGQPGPQPGQPGQPPGQPGQEPGSEPEEGPRPGQGDPGVPPELAKLGVSAKDWEKLKGVMRSDVAGGGGAEIPEDYRGLVRKYFEQMAKGER